MGGTGTLDFGPSGPALITDLLPIPVLQRGIQGLAAGYGTLSYPAGNVRGAKTYAYFREQGMRPEELQEFQWKQFLADPPTQWWDNRENKRSSRLPDFRHKRSKIALWLDNRHKPAWVVSQLASWDAGKVGALGRDAAVEESLDVKMCRKLCEDGRITDAVDALNLVVGRGCRVENNLFYLVLKTCIAHKDLGLGRRIHALTVKGGYKGDAFLATHLIGLYASLGKLVEAKAVFTDVRTPSAHNWATIIFAYARHGDPAEGIRLYRRMRELTSVEADNHIYSAVLTACAAARDLVAGKEVHSHILAGAPGKLDRFVQTCLVNMYAKCGSVQDARSMFDEGPEKDLVTLNAMLAGYSQQGMGQEALCLYASMEQQGLTQPDVVTFVCLLQACAGVGVGALRQGKQLHAQIEDAGLQENVVVGTSLIDMYAKCGSIDDARRVFDCLVDRDVVTWTAMIAGYAQQGMMGEQALGLYSSMQVEGFTPPDSVTYVCLLQACASIGAEALQEGRQLHARIEEQRLQADLVVGNSLVNMYAKCGSLEDARSVFDGLPDRNVVTWTALIAGYAQQGLGEEALSLYGRMEQEGRATPNSVTFVCLLQACAIVTTLPLGKQLHAQIEERGLKGDSVVGAALVNMYAKCGSVRDAQDMFDCLSERTTDTWNALIGGYTHRGDSDNVFQLLHRMISLEGAQPDGITFLNVLTVCSHVGLVDEGRKYFQAMSADHGISPGVEHYTCMMDLLGRAGHLNEALQMGKTMPFPPDDTAGWVTLLGACRKWNNVEIGQHAFELAVRVDGKDAAPYVLMSNIYASAKMWEAAREMQARRVKSGAWKKPGQSWWADTGGVVHTFVVGEKKHPACEDIVSMQGRNSCSPK